MYDPASTTGYEALPDPDDQPEFYGGVVPKRLLAWIVDTVLIIGLSAVVVILTVGIGLIFFGLLYLFVGFAYRAMTLANWSATPGMRLMAIELRRRDGLRLDGTTAMLHTAGYTFCVALPFLQAISVVSMLISVRGQGLVDHALGTVMLNKTL